MDNYNYHDWTKFMVRTSKEKPTGSHFAAVLFETKSEWTPPYDHHDNPGGSSSTVPTVTYFAFPDKETLGEWVLRAAKDKKEFFFFEVKKVGQAELKVNIDVSV